MWYADQICKMSGYRRKREAGKEALGKESSMNKWISVKDAVPDTDREVLVIVNGMAGKKVKFVNAIMIGLFDKAEGWILEDWPEVTHFEVLYWMDLPELPEELRRSDGGVVW